MYTLEIYVTHMYMNHLFSKVADNAFFTVPGFTTFTISLICTIVLTGIVIVTLKSILPRIICSMVNKIKRE